MKFALFFTIRLVALLSYTFAVIGYFAGATMDKWVFGMLAGLALSICALGEKE